MKAFLEKEKNPVLFTRRKIYESTIATNALLCKFQAIKQRVVHEKATATGSRIRPGEALINAQLAPTWWFIIAISI